MKQKSNWNDNMRQEFITKRFQMKYNTEYILFEVISWDTYKNHYTAMINMYEIIRMQGGGIITEMDVYRQFNTLQPIDEYGNGFKSIKDAQEWIAKKLHGLGSVQTWAD